MYARPSYLGWYVGTINNLLILFFLILKVDFCLSSQREKKILTIVLVIASPFVQIPSVLIETVFCGFIIRADLFNPCAWL
jgi:hypothetical protein